ncbi:MAG: hypothetical protein HY856_21215 [Burkholderiales bacterium]|nr:hypothetical protein [Burkholderiales bacterium]
MRTFAWGLSFGMGFLSLSEEILWIRWIGFLQHGVPHAFSAVLCLYLLGIALGASAGRRLCQGAHVSLERAAAVLLAAAAVDWLVPTVMVHVDNHPPAAALGVSALVLTASAALKAALFPVAHHLGTRLDSDRVGRSLSRVYLMNILGSTLGPLLTGFVLLEWLSLDAGFRAIGCGSALLAAWSLAMAARPRRVVAWCVGTAAALGLATEVAAPAPERMLLAHAARPDGPAPAPVNHLIANRHGVLHTVAGGPAGDIVYGGNVYDGRTNTSLVVNSNRIDRCYLLSLVHDRPRRVLVIGMSTGAWLRVLTAMDGVEQIDVVEINPGYLRLVDGYPHLREGMRDPRVTIHIDDGRRWLKRHAQPRFDLVVMNTTFYWRAQSTSLLSHQFLGLVRSRMADGAVIAFNSTGLPDALHTAAHVFPHAYRWHNFVYASDHDFRASLGRPGAVERLAALEGRLTPASRDEQRAAAAQRLLAQSFETLAEVAARSSRPLELIDDDTLQPEFRLGRGLTLY